MKKLILSALAAVLFVVPNAMAEIREGSFYAGVDAGYGYVKGDAQETANALVSVLGGSVTVTQETRTVAGRFFAGYNITRMFGLEVGYLLTGDLSTRAAGVASNGVAYTGSADASVSGVDYALLVRPIDTMDGLFVKAGGHYVETSIDWSLTAAGRATATTDERGSGFLVGLGYEAPISDVLDYRVAYTYYDRLSGLTDNNSSLVTLGLVARF